MRNGKLNGVLSFSLVLALVVACNFTTANISSVVLSPNRDGSAPTTTFSPNATVYAIATVSNSMSPVTVRARLYTENVEGEAANTMVPNSEIVVNLESSGTAIFNYSRAGGMLPGTYRIDIAMLVGSEQKDQESVTFTVS